MAPGRELPTKKVESSGSGSQSGPPIRSRVELWIPATYAVVTAAWIVLSDLVLGHTARSQAVQTTWSILKGIGFVAATTLALHAGLRRALGRERSARHRLEASEAALRESEERYRRLFEFSADAILAIDLEGRFTDANTAALRMLGYTLQEMRALSFRQITPVRWHEMNEAIVRDQIPARGYSDEYEKEYIRKDGSTVPVSVRAAVKMDSAAVRAGVWAIVRDITERKRAENALRASEERLRAMSSIGTEGVMVHDDGVILDANEAFARLLGRGCPADLVGQNGFETMPLTPASLEALRDHFRTGSDETYDIEVTRPDGSLMPAEVSARDIVYQGRRARAVTLRDISFRKRAEAEHARLEAGLRQAQKMESLGRLAGGVAHDFNNLLTVILNCAEELKHELGAARPAAQDLVQDIAAAGERARDVTRQMLAFARRHVINPVPLNLGALARGTEKWLRRVLGEDVEVLVTSDPKLWSVRCDPGHIEQVILNLAVNARDAMVSGGKLTIETANAQVDERLIKTYPFMRTGPFVRLRIRDSGHGMSPEVKAHAFEPFFTTKPEGQGTGLGLATVYGIVKQSDGYILMDSEIGRGTTFEIYFPRISDAPVETGAPSVKTATRGTETIIVVEDDPHVRAVTERSLRTGGYVVLAAGAGREALDMDPKKLSSARLLITDVVMPDLSGRALAEEMRCRYPALRVLYVSGYTADAISQRGVLESGIEFLAKPFTTYGLLARVRAILDSPT